jgi:hypothetical protein
MLADPAVLTPDPSEVDERGLPRTARRGTTLPAPLARRAAGLAPAPDAVGAFLDYAAFVLEQEAEYCQQ